VVIFKLAERAQSDVVYPIMSLSNRYRHWYFRKGLLLVKKKEEVRTPRINSLFLYLAYFRKITSNKKSGIPELNLDFAAFAYVVEGSGKSSDIHADIEAVINAKSSIENICK